MDSPSSIIPFESPEFGTIRTVEEDGNVLFCGSDVARALGYKRPNDALKQHCRSGATVFHRPIVDQLGREQQARFSLSFVIWKNCSALIILSKHGLRLSSRVARESSEEKKK